MTFRFCQFLGLETGCVGLFGLLCKVQERVDMDKIYISESSN